MKRYLKIYLDAYSGLSKPVWMLALVMLINRTGTMVVPFLSIYAREAMGFTMRETGIVLGLFGMGSIAGAWLGGWLTDRVGHFLVQFLSMVLGGVLFMLVSGLDHFYSFAVGIFFVSVVADAMRPANGTAFASYARPENVARAFSLNRMAFNLGFSLGPALGGFLATISFRLLFIADGFTCILAGLVFYFYFRGKTGRRDAAPSGGLAEVIRKSPYRDLGFLVVSVLQCAFAVVFFQLLSTLPLYYKEVYGLSEGSVGLLLALNGFVVFALEMILVYVLGKLYSTRALVVVGVLLTGASLVVLNVYHHAGVLLVSMVGLSVAEILVMPFLAAWVVERSEGGSRGAYMGMLTMSYSIALTVAPLIGTFIAGKAGYTMLWYAMGALSVLSAAGFYRAMQRHPAD